MSSLGSVLVCVMCGEEEGAQRCRKGEEEDCVWEWGLESANYADPEAKGANEDLSTVSSEKLQVHYSQRRACHDPTQQR